MTAIARRLARTAWTAIGGDAAALDALSFTDGGDLPSTYAVTDLACAAISAATLAVSELIGSQGKSIPAVTIDRRLSSFWFGWSIRPIGWEMPAVWDPIAGDYRTGDGWIRLHTNASHHRAAAEHVLGSHVDKDGVARAAARWAKRDLESAIIDAGGCAAEMRSAQEWADHPQGRAVAAEPLAYVTVADRTAYSCWTPSPSRPLEGLRVLDLTRVLAGPVASRFLAGYGAEVLRIDPPGWDEPGVIPEVTLGKRCALLDLRDRRGRAAFEVLLSEADILLHGYRPGALDGLGYDAVARRAISPGLIDVSLSAYGWSGPWAPRRGFDSLVQMSAGIADAGMRWRQADKPTPLPVQALDHATGYLMAATTILAVNRRLREGTGTEARLSLARTAKLLVDAGDGYTSTPIPPETAADLAQTVEATDWGDARRLNPPAAIEGAPMHWTRPATKIGSAKPTWS
ncbi:CoA transferase [Virgifigura deserti]|uniref:CoA transferase n=1 Tax=Virgifigura deserti TaxID=2268457 RepID=UPI003CCBD958